MKKVIILFLSFILINFSACKIDNKECANEILLYNQNFINAHIQIEKEKFNQIIKDTTDFNYKKAHVFSEKVNLLIHKIDTDSLKTQDVFLELQDFGDYIDIDSLKRFEDFKLYNLSLCEKSMLKYNLKFLELLFYQRINNIEADIYFNFKYVKPIIFQANDGVYYSVLTAANNIENEYVSTIRDTFYLEDNGLVKLGKEIDKNQVFYYNFAHKRIFNKEDIDVRIKIESIID